MDTFFRVVTPIIVKGIQDLFMNRRQNNLQLQRPPPEQDTRWSSSQKNLEFYQNKIPSEPDGAKIDEILSNWYGDYKKLTEHLFYIQWLFPNKAGGTNALASPLTDEEAREISSDPILRKRFLSAFKMILDLYGISLNDRNEFKLKDDDPKFLEHLISHAASPMWITRILISLKELGHKDLMCPWLWFLRKLIFEDRLLPPKFEESFDKFWVQTLDLADQGSEWMWKYQKDDFQKKRIAETNFINPYSNKFEFFSKT